MKTKKLTKPEAADFLGVSERALERYMTKHHIPVEYENKEGGGRRAWFLESDLIEFRKMLDSPRSTALTTTPPSGGEVFGALAAAITEAMPQVPTRDVELKDKLTLSLSEAARYSGVGVGTLEDATATGMLHSLRVGQRGARVVLRSDLEQYVSDLFERGGKSSTE